MKTEKGKTPKAYANVLFDLAGEQKALEAVHGELAEVRALIRSSRELAAFLGVACFMGTRGWLIVEELFQRRVSSLTYHLLKLLHASGHLGLLERVIDQFERLYKKATGVVDIRIETAFALAEEQMERIRDTLAKRLNCRVTAEMAINPGLLGGLKIRVEDTVYDMSLAGRLSRLESLARNT